MTDLNRRDVLCQGLAGLAAAGSGSLLLAETAAPTNATPDLHNYQDFLDKKGIPQIAPAAVWKPTHPDILGPFHVPGSPFRGKVTAPLAEGTTLVVRGRLWGFDTKKPVSNAVLDVWQADHKGRYDMTNPRQPPKWHEFQNRIRLVTELPNHPNFVASARTADPAQAAESKVFVSDLERLAPPGS